MAAASGRGLSATGRLTAATLGRSLLATAALGRGLLLTACLLLQLRLDLLKHLRRHTQLLQHLETFLRVNLPAFDGLQHILDRLLSLSLGALLAAAGRSLLAALSRRQLGWLTWCPTGRPRPACQSDR